MKLTTNVLSHAKMSDLIIAYPNMITILERMGIVFGFGDQRVHEIAGRYGINLEAFIAILQSFEESIRCNTVLEKEAIPDLLSFLKASHKHFKEKQIPHIKQLIELFSESIPLKHGRVIISFFDGYIKEVEEHFHYEDDDIFPYITDILKDPHPAKFRITEFAKNHTDIEQKLLDLKKILIKYIPEDITSNYRIQILRALITFEQDLIHHTVIEDRLLVPSIKQMETDLQN